MWKYGKQKHAFRSRLDLSLDLSTYILITYFDDITEDNEDSGRKPFRQPAKF